MRGIHTNLSRGKRPGHLIIFFTNYSSVLSDFISVVKFQVKDFDFSF